MGLSRPLFVYFRPFHITWFFCSHEYSDVNISALLNSFQMGYDKRVRPNYGGKANTPAGVNLIKEFQSRLTTLFRNEAL